MRKQPFNYIFLLGIILLTTWILIAGPTPASIPQIIGGTNKVFFLAGILCMGGYWMVDALIIQQMSAVIDIQISLKSAFRYTMIGQYFNLVTPGASGGQPAQIYAMTVKGNYSLSQAASVLINKFVIFQLVLTAYSLLLFSLTASSACSIDNIRYYAAAGITINLLSVVFIYAAARNTSWLTGIIQQFFNFLHKCIQVSYNPEIIKHTVHELAHHVNSLKNNPLIIIETTLLTLIQLTFYFSISYFVYISFYLHSFSFLQILSIQALLYMVVSFIPTPGNAGVSEGLYYLLFQLLYPLDIIVASIILWRFIIYYFNFLVSGCVTLYDYLFINTAAH